MEREEIPRIVDELLERTDAQAFEIMSKILDEVRANIARETTQRSLGQVALSESEFPKTP